MTRVQVLFEVIERCRVCRGRGTLLQDESKMLMRGCPVAKQICDECPFSLEFEMALQDLPDIREWMSTPSSTRGRFYSVGCIICYDVIT